MDDLNIVNLEGLDALTEAAFLAMSRSEDPTAYMTLAATGPAGPETPSVEALVEAARALTECQMEAAFEPGQPKDYHPSYVGRTPADQSPAQTARFHTEATQWAASTGLPPSIGDYVIERAMDVGQAYNRKSDLERDAFKVDQRAQFERMSGGPEKAAARVEAVAKMLAGAPEAFNDALFASGALHDAAIVAHLANHA